MDRELTAGTTSPLYDIIVVMLRVIIVLALLLTVDPAVAQVIYSGSDHKQVALTFDDGPSPVFTDEVLDILRSENVPATFFVIGKKIEKYPSLLKRIAMEGHELGNHTYTHSKITRLSEDELSSEVEKTSSLISKYTGHWPAFFRPPYGATSRARSKFIESEGYDVVLWHVNADDFYHMGWGMRSADSITKRVLARARGGDVILMHDYSGQVVDALPKIIRALKHKGYQFVTMSELEMGRQAKSRASL